MKYLKLIISYVFIKTFLIGIDQTPFFLLFFHRRLLPYLQNRFPIMLKYKYGWDLNMFPVTISIIIVKITKQKYDYNIIITKPTSCQVDQIALL